MRSVRIPSLSAAALAATLFVCHPSPAGANPGLHVRFEARVGGHLARLLMEPAVQRELGMTAAQVSAVQARMPGPLLIAAPQDGTPPEQVAAEAEAEQQRRMAEFERAAAGILSEAQLKRARQLTLQLEGPAALDRAEIADQLDLTPEQRQQVTQTLRTSEEKMRALMKAQIPGIAPPAAIQAAMTQSEALRKAADRALLDLLTDAQQQRWKSLMGQPFQFPNELLGGHAVFGHFP